MKRIGTALLIGAILSLGAPGSEAMVPWSAPAIGGIAGSHLARSVSLGTLTMTAVHPRIFTPNGDGANDKVRFEFDNPELLPVEGEVFDITGARVASLIPGSDPSSLLLWDGKDSDGRAVPGGIYLYQIEFQGKHATGTVVVAR